MGEPAGPMYSVREIRTFIGTAEMRVRPLLHAMAGEASQECCAFACSGIRSVRSNNVLADQWGSYRALQAKSSNAEQRRSPPPRAVRRLVLARTATGMVLHTTSRAIGWHSLEQAPQHRATPKRGGQARVRRRVLPRGCKEP